MNLQEFRKQAKAAGFTVKKLRDLEVVRVSRGSHAIADARYADIFWVRNFQEWHQGKIAPKSGSMLQ